MGYFYTGSECDKCGEQKYRAVQNTRIVSFDISRHKPQGEKHRDKVFHNGLNEWIPAGSTKRHITERHEQRGLRVNWG